MLAVFTLIGSVQATPITPNITRIFGQDRFQTSVAVAKQAFPGQQLQNVIIASGYNFPDALAVSPLAYKLHAPILLVGNSVSESQSSLDYVKESLAPSGTVTIVGGTAVVSEPIEEWLSNAGYKVVRLGGKDRFDTNALINEQLNVAVGTTVFIVNGYQFQDALAVSSAAAKNGFPILLSDPKGLSEPAKIFLSKEQPKLTYIVDNGDFPLEPVIADIVKVSPNTLFLHPTRYGLTSNMIGSSKTDIFVASENNFADALAGSVVAAQLDAPIFLVDPAAKALPRPLWDGLRSSRNGSSLPKINILGGSVAVPGSVVDLIKAGFTSTYVDIEQNPNINHSDILSIDTLYMTVNEGDKATLPSTLPAKMKDGTIRDVYVTWTIPKDPLFSLDTSRATAKVFFGKVNHIGSNVNAVMIILPKMPTDVWVAGATIPTKVSIRSLVPLIQTIHVGEHPINPKTFTAVMEDGTLREFPTEWMIYPDQLTYDKVGSRFISYGNFISFIQGILEVKVLP